MYPTLTFLLMGLNLAVDSMLEPTNSAPEPVWRIVNDTVMGGRSWSRVEPRKPSGIVFLGSVSLENNGGFASARLASRGTELTGYEGLSIRVRGDGKTYQLRLRTNDRFDGVAYRAKFTTKDGAWKTVKIPFSRFQPSFRGRLLTDVARLDPKDIRQIGFLIADGQSGPFRLEIESVAPYPDIRFEDD